MATRWPFLHTGKQVRRNPPVALYFTLGFAEEKTSVGKLVELCCWVRGKLVSIG